MEPVFPRAAFAPWRKPLSETKTMAQKKFYAVARGRKTGVFPQWFGPGGAHGQINGYPNARYKGFLSEREALAWLAKFAEGKIKDHPGGASNPSAGAKPPVSAPAPAPPASVPEPAGNAAENDAGDDTITVYTDGGCLMNPGPGGYGVVRLSQGRAEEFSEGFRLTTNNRMELLACVAGLTGIPKGCKVELFSDSQYVVHGLVKGWARAWRAKGWIKADKTPAKNPDLWARLLDLYEALEVRAQWVRGHVGIPLNERCDQLADMAARKENLLRDTEYEKGAGIG
jgi:ribonuclease HI